MIPSVSEQSQNILERLGASQILERLDQWPALGVLALGAALVFVVLFPLWLRQRARHRASQSERERLIALAQRAREIIASTPDGLFLWDHQTGGITCSRRLADMLDLQAGPDARYDDIRKCFGGDDLKSLEQAVSLLRGRGEAFEIMLRREDQVLQAVGARAETRDGDGLADVVWVRDLSALAKELMPPTPRNTSGLDDRHLTTLLDSLPLPIWIRDRELNLAFANVAAEAMSPPDPNIAEAARRGEESVVQDQLFSVTENENAAEREMTVTETPLGGNGGSGTIGYAVPRGVTEMPATGPVSETPDRNPAVLAALETGISVFDAEQRLLMHNPAFATIWGLDPDWLEIRPTLGELLDRLRELRRLPEVTDFQAFKAAALERFETLTDIDEGMMHLPDGRTLRRRIAPDGLGGLVFAYDDMSDRFDLERNVKSLDRVQRATLDNLGEGIAVFGSDGRLTLCNPEFRSIWRIPEDGFEPETRLGEVLERMRDLLPTVEDWPARKEALAAAILSRKQRRERLERPDGRIIDIAHLPLPDGAVLVSYLDVTDSVRVEDALRQRARALAEADRMKSAFIANVSHEVRTPLNTIQGFADMLSEEYFGPLTPRQAEYARGIADTARSLTGVVADVIDLATIQAGRMELARDTVDVHALLAGALNLSRERARRKDINLHFDCAPNIGHLVGDEQRLKQVVFHLLGNALTFTPDRGTVTLAAERAAIGPDDGFTIRVSDTGRGIPQNDRERVVAPFERGGHAGDDGDGAGLGLTLVKNFIELHGGTIEIGANAARGTTVTCHVPADGRRRRDGVETASDDESVDGAAGDDMLSSARAGEPAAG